MADRESVNPWFSASTACEARGLLKLLDTGSMTAEEIRELVGISEAGGRGLDELVRENPHLAGRIQAARVYRENVRREFDLMVAAEGPIKVKSASC